MTAALLPSVVVGPNAAEYCIIWLHGLGADGHDFEPVVPELSFTKKTQTRFIFPHAPRMPVTINNGYVMPAWFDLVGIDRQSPEDEAGIRNTEQKVRDIIQYENSRGIPSQRIILAGFSQGGAIALHTGLRYPEPLAGIMALSTYLPLHATLASQASEANQTVPIFMAHGIHDPVVPLSLAEHSRHVLQENNYQVDWHTYPMAHSLLPEEITDINRWLTGCFHENNKN